MPDKIDDPRKSAGKTTGQAPGSKKPSALLDLEAKEVGDPATPRPALSAPPPTGKDEPARPRPAQAAAPSPAGVAGSGPSAAATERGGSVGSGTTGKAPRPGEGGASDGADAPRSRLRGTLVSHAGAGLAGGLLALLIAMGLGSLLWPARPDDAAVRAVEDLRRRLAVAENSLAAAPRDAAAASVADKLATLEGRLARFDEAGRKVEELAEGQARLASQAQALEARLQQPQAPAELAERIARLEQTIARLSAAAANDPQPGRIPQLAALSGKLSDLETTLANQLGALRKSVAQEIDTRIAQAQEAGEAARSGTQRLDRELATVKAEGARLAQRAESLKAAGDALQQGLRAVQEDAAAIRAGIEAFKADMAAQLKAVTRPQDLAAALAPATDKIAAMEKDLQSVLANEEQRKANAERVVLALEIGNLKRAIDRGAKYAAELAAVKQMAGPRIDVAALERYKDEGLPTPAELARRFRGVANAMLDAESAPADASTLDRLLQGAKSIVRVRRSEHRAGDTSVEAMAARMEQALGEGRLADVLTEAAMLPPKARLAAEDWLDLVAARAAADRALAGIEEQLKASLGGKAQPEKRS